MPEIRLTGVDGAQIGIVRTSEALAMAEEAGVDLVEVEKYQSVNGDKEEKT